MDVAARARLVLARRPWIYWLIVVALAGSVALYTNGRLAAIDDARDEWGRTRVVLVADGPLRAGDPVATRSIELPVAALPAIALTDIPAGTMMRQRAGDGEVLTSLDVTTAPGPAAGAEPGSVVVAIADPLARGLEAGVRVQVAADGLVLAESGTVVDVIDEVVYVAIGEHDGPIVAAASQQGIATLLYLP